MATTDFRKIIDTLTQIDEGRLAKGNRDQWVTGQHISNSPIPLTNKAPKSSGSDWMLRAAFGDNYEDKIKPLYLDPANNRFQFIGGWSDKENAFVYFPNNTAKTLKSAQARGIRELFAAKGMKEGEDYILDQQHELLKIFKKTR